MPRAWTALIVGLAIAVLAGCTSAPPPASSSLANSANPSPSDGGSATGVASTPTPGPTASDSGIYASRLYGYLITLPSGWLAGQQALLPWDGVEAISHTGLDVDQFVGPDRTVGWAYAALTTKTLADYVQEGEAASARDHPCPASPETDEAVTIGGEPANLTGMHCPSSGGILVLIAYTIHDGTGFGFAFQDPSGDPSAEEADRTAFREFISAIQFKP